MMPRVCFHHTKAQAELLLLQGDITAVHADAIVTGQAFFYKGKSAVTRSLIKLYPELETARNKLFRNGELQDWQVYKTILEKPHPVIMHAVMAPGNNQHWLQLMKKLYSRVFTEAEKLNGVQTLALPVLGTGVSGSDTKLAIQALVTSLRDYTPGYIRLILVVNQSHDVLELVEGYYKHSLLNPEPKGSFWGSVLTDVKLAFSFSYVDEAKLEEDKKKREDERDAKDEVLQRVLMLSQQDTGNSETSNCSPYETDSLAYPGDGWKDGQARARPLDQSDEGICPICLNTVDDPKMLPKCGHVFCRDCIDSSFKQYKPVCPSCNMVYGEIRGNQPDGQMDVGFSGEHLPGYEGHGTITITYYFPSGTQGERHPHPGKAYKGTTRRAFLPDSQEGKLVLSMLRRAFDQRLVFTIGQSTSTGRDDVVTWNDIHHKTSKEGGPTRFGYPDPTYLERVKEELASKGITSKGTK